MEGYSVTEAASVLGVPTERVWELLARGVLAGHPEGDSGMRVFLQPRATTPSPMDLPPPTPPPAREPERELSPFRELLTEFRNLTERYGQALLALGEARGEVASLRSRVDLLEARMDLRLPMGAPISASVGWDAPAAAVAEPPASPVRRVEPGEEVEPISVEPVGLEPLDATDTAETTATSDAVDTTGAADGVAITDGSADAGDADEAEAERHRRRRSHHHATESFAEALARAEDPTVPELPEPHRDAIAEAAVIEAGLPRELPAAEPIPTADEEGGSVEAALAIPELVAPEPVDVTASQHPPAEASAAEPEPADEPTEVQLDRAPEEPGWSYSEAAFAPESLEAADELVPSDQPEPVEAAAVVTPDAVDDEQEFVAELEPEPVDEPSEPESAATPPEPEVPSDPLVWDPERYTTEIGEPDWYAEEEPAPASSETPSTPPEATPAASIAADAAPDATDAATDEETVLWFGNQPRQRREPAAPIARDEGPAAAEIAASPTAGSEPEDRAADAAGDPLDALDALARSAGRDATTEGAWPRTGEPRPQRHDAAAPPSQGTTGAAWSTRSGTPPTTASRAYRRLRRIFPG